jgi:predicted O-methyltransferase YrrM
MTSAFDELIQKIHRGVNPYEGFWPFLTPDRGPNWGNDHHWFKEAIEELRPRIVIEVGSFLGGSAIQMGKCLKALGLDSAIVCVDTWLAEDMLWLSDEWRPHLIIRHGRPEFYINFLQNIGDAGLTDLIIPLPMDSAGGARLLAKLGVSASLIYLDGSHQTGDVRRDLEFYWPLLEPGGILLADDYDNPDTPSAVSTEVRDFTEARGVPFEVSGLKARIRRPK